MLCGTILFCRRAGTLRYISFVPTELAKVHFCIESLENVVDVIYYNLMRERQVKGTKKRSVVDAECAAVMCLE